VRDGWLFKGLKLLHESPEKLVGEFSADWLGVGKNMAKSIRHWLFATELAEWDGNGKHGKKKILAPTALGKVIYERDKYLSAPGTWWMLHINLIHSQHSTAAWSWFFNNFGDIRFARSFCHDSMSLSIASSAKRQPSKTTLQKDLNCLLASYARKIPEERTDVEEALDSPFIELGIMDFYRSSGTFQRNQGPKDVPPDVLGYCLAHVDEGSEMKSGHTDMKITDAVGRKDGLGRCLSLNSEALLELASAAEKTTKGKSISIVGLAGSRAIRFANKSSLSWAKSFYHSSK
jgi:hypothetical protein